VTWTPEQKAEFTRLYNAGTAVETMAARLGFKNCGSVYNWARLLGLRRVHYRRYSPGEDNIIRRDFATYVSIPEIARKLGRDHRAVEKRIHRRLGLRRPRTVYAYPTERREQRKAELAMKCAEIERPNLPRNSNIFAKWMTGITLAAIGRQYGISRERVRQIVNRVQLLDRCSRPHDYMSGRGV
jgi:transposase-like protein